jgi:hypothetical protein
MAKQAEEKADIEEIPETNLEVKNDPGENAQEN